MADFSKGAAWIRGDIKPIEEATIGVTDWAVTHSDATYDVVPVWEGAFFRLGDYLDRFEASLAAWRMEIGMNRADIMEALHAMVARSDLRNAYVAMVAARGVPAIPDSRDPRDCANHFYAWCVPYIHVVTPEIAANGARVWLDETHRRIPPESVDPRVKNYHWGDFTQGLFAAKDAGFDTVLLPDGAGNVTEGPGFNVFALTGERVVTPEAGVLHGITRRNALEMCEEAGLQVERRALPLAELLEADEVFLSTSGGGIVPVAQIGERRFSNGSAGPVASQLRARYFERLAEPRFRTEINYGA
ncbi:branched-chain amino acid--2-keto-4-methylthiobutyrate aminotransferase [Roseovarius spongiae]|uniref:Probable branched-chain-amino-acid aminotransferase n=1 Tax=Roseovarius spongiae TaxID=2320272 RepID=A0A3A8BB17_9RHOB|nr:aminotransferase class IV [Roseovarius spongiae]RKF16462.1 branched-chain amino acid--2-keto-4-methylthiobutyrate aminotransferase [Roseovarius spongiae]